MEFPSMWNDRNIFLKGPHAPHHGEGESVDQVAR